ncbi:MAG: exodeoxyribonuclease V subunit alpha [Oleispira sp.]|nr:exodeoxyribonuclease V subunit alpha [Oleispira sp.]
MFDSLKSLKSWLQSVFELDGLKAIDIELASSLCWNEISLSKQTLSDKKQSGKTLNETAVDETAVKVYAYLIIKLSQALSRGEVCIDYSQLYDIQQKAGIVLAELNSHLKSFITVHAKDENLAGLANQDPYDLVINYPLVSMQGRLYFSRYWFYQQQVYFCISSRLRACELESSPLGNRELGSSELSSVLQQLFPPSQQPTNTQPDWQMIAAANACLNRFSVITGGPGTGKTTTVTRLLAALISQQPNLRIALAAPTGKAAARLVESILAAKSQLAKTFPLAEKIPVTSFTLHRLLGWRPNGFTYNHKKTLPYDLVIVDEASMVDLPMMAQLMEALAENTRLILLGDKDQLASVEAGSVLGDLCDSGISINDYPAHGIQNDRAKQLEQLCGFEMGQLNAFVETNAPLMANSLTQLRVSHRFTRDSGIGKLATAVNVGRADWVSQSFQQYDDIHFYTCLAAPFSKDKTDHIIAAEQAWQQQVVNGYGHYLNAIEQGQSPFDVLQLFNKFQLLCALRQGSSGLHALNERVQTLLHARGLLNIDMTATAVGQNRWYVGRPVMISRNDYELNLFNGDIGIAMMVESTSSASRGKQELKVCFIDSASNGGAETGSDTASDNKDSKIRQLLPTRLPEHETAFAMTVHKSQGSEFEDVALVLPDVTNAVISRELIYTAITRGKKSFSLYSNQQVLEQGINSRIERASGLRDLLFS